MILSILNDPSTVAGCAGSFCGFALAFGRRPSPIYLLCCPGNKPGGGSRLPSDGKRSGFGQVFADKAGCTQTILSYFTSQASYRGNGRSSPGDECLNLRKEIRNGTYRSYPGEENRRNITEIRSLKPIWRQWSLPPIAPPPVKMFSETGEI